MREPDAGDTIFRDMITLCLMGFVALVIIMLAHINPRAKQAVDGDNAPGNVIVEIQWPDGLDVDVDLWVQAPGDVPVGYSNKGGDFFNLLRDDLGRVADVTDLNYEVAYSRGIPTGEYTVNIHSYRGDNFPVPVKAVVSVKLSPEESTRQLLITTLELRKENEELTAFRFRLDANGNVVPGSLSKIYKPLRVAAK